MRIVRMGLLLAAVAGFLRTNTALACDVSGTFVCARDTSIVVANQPVNFDLIWTMWEGPTSFVAYTDANGSLATHVGWETTWNVSYYGPMYCGAGEGSNTYLGVVLVPNSNPACTPPSQPADCSPGYYKNHPETWCVQCGFEAVCSEMLEDLAARGPGSAEIRDATKAQIDACFGTGANSPCVDDDS